MTYFARTTIGGTSEDCPAVCRPVCRRRPACPQAQRGPDRRHDHLDQVHGAHDARDTRRGPGAVRARHECHDPRATDPPGHDHGSQRGDRDHVFTEHQGSVLQLLTSRSTHTPREELPPQHMGALRSWGCFHPQNTRIQFATDASV